MRENAARIGDTIIIIIMTGVEMKDFHAVGRKSINIIFLFHNKNVLDFNLTLIEHVVLAICDESYLWNLCERQNEFRRY